MMYCSIEDVTNLTGVKSKQWFKNSDNPEEELQKLLEDWITLASDAIDKYCNRQFPSLSETTTPPGTVRLACSLMVSNLMAFAQTRRDTPIIKHNDWNVDFLKVEFMDDNIREMLEEYRVSKVNSSKLSIFTVYREEE